MGKEQEPDDQYQRRRIAIRAARLSGVFGLTLLVGFAFFGDWQPDIIKLQFAAIIGLPMAAVAAFVIVAFFDQAEAPLEFEVPGLKFKGSSGQILLWVVCFLAIVGAIKLLWESN